MAEWRNIDIWTACPGGTPERPRWFIGNYAHDREPGKALPIIGEAASEEECRRICAAANARNLELIEATPAERAYVEAQIVEGGNGEIGVPPELLAEVKAINLARWAPWVEAHPQA